MRKDNFILIAAILVVVALVIGIPTFVTGCGGDYGSADCGRLAQQIQDRDMDCSEYTDCPGMQGRGMGCDETSLGSDWGGDCDSECDGDCEGAGSIDDEPFGSEPICF